MVKAIWIRDGNQPPTFWNLPFPRGGLSSRGGCVCVWVPWAVRIFPAQLGQPGKGEEKQGLEGWGEQQTKGRELEPAAPLSDDLQAS